MPVVKYNIYHPFFVKTYNPWSITVHYFMTISIYTKFYLFILIVRASFH